MVLFYNCNYMREICTNVRNFQKTSRGKTLHPLSGVAGDRYGIDFNKGRKDERRSKNCPDTWKTYHTCPEIDQQMPMRDDGVWYFTSLEPGTTDNTIMHLRDTSGNILKPSKIRYTCDEFPPASWVEGGNGVAADQPGQTRCAAMKCQAKTKAEQDCACGKSPRVSRNRYKRQLTVYLCLCRAGNFPYALAH